MLDNQSCAKVTVALHSCCSSGRKEKPTDPVEWTVMDVVEYFTEAGFPEQATAFQEQVSPGPGTAVSVHTGGLRVCPDPAPFCPA